MYMYERNKTEREYSQEHARIQKVLPAGGPNLKTFILVDEGIEDPNITINGSSSARQRNAI